MKEVELGGFISQAPGDPPPGEVGGLANYRTLIGSFNYHL